MSVREGHNGRVKPEQIQEWVAKRVAKHKQLTGGVAIVDEVPKSASGKIQRKIVREWAKRDADEIAKKRRPKAKL